MEFVDLADQGVEMFTIEVGDGAVVDEDAAGGGSDHHESTAVVQW
jgi:hypothetical protein